MNKQKITDTIFNFETYLTEVDEFLEIITDICENASISDKTAAKILFITDLFKDKNNKAWDFIHYDWKSYYNLKCCQIALG